MRILHSSTYHSYQHQLEDLQNLNIRTVYLESLSDILGSVGVLVAGVIMLTIKFYLADVLNKYWTSVIYDSPGLVYHYECC